MIHASWPPDLPGPAYPGPWRPPQPPQAPVWPVPVYPATDARAKADINAPVARPRRCSGNTSVTIVIAIPPSRPPKAPVSTRAAIRAP